MTILNRVESEMSLLNKKLDGYSFLFSELKVIFQFKIVINRSS